MEYYKMLARKHLAIILATTLIQAQAQAQAVDNTNKTTKVAKDTSFMYVKLNVGATFAGHLWDSNSAEKDSSGKKIAIDTSAVGSTAKTGIAAGMHWSQDYKAELEYIWIPVSYSFFDEDDNFYQDKNARIDALFVNVFYESNYFSTKYQPYIGGGLGMIFNNLKTLSSDALLVASKESKKSSLAAQIRVGFNHDLSEGFTWGLEYGYLMGLQDSETYMTNNSNEDILLKAPYKTQFANIHITMRF
jgi:hypothetical protein